MARQLLDDHELGVVPVGFVDDNPVKSGRTIHNLKVLGGSSSFGTLCREHQVDEILITTPRITKTDISRVSRDVPAVAVKRMRLVMQETDLWFDSARSDGR